MKNIKSIAVLLVAGAALSLPFASTRSNDTADTILAQAEKQAAGSEKNVLVIYTASWCPWCHKLEGFLKQPKIAATVNKNYVTILVDVQEQPEKKSLETPGGDTAMESMGGKDAGLPYYVVISEKGKVLASSAKPGTGPASNRNIGYPAKPDEIAYFMEMLHSTGKHLSASDEGLIKDTLASQAPH